ncbi:unnamed protein product [Paramecium primaurelia]|uniref:Uncharacterized protein n=1 Tax=Paramecium primaurelia TaxID=5886 RepID=A0A8S1QKR0_PARPR|nr:unnamed protein product [Paramecium primaurelia]
MKNSLTRSQKYQKINNNDESPQSQYDGNIIYYLVQITINTRKSSISINTVKTVNLRIDDKAKKNVKDVVFQQKKQITELIHPKNYLKSEHTDKNFHAKDQQCENLIQKNPSSPNSIKKQLQLNQLKFTKPNVSPNKKTEDLKNQIMNVSDNLYTPTERRQKNLKTYLYSINKQESKQELEKKLNEGDSFQIKIKQDVTKSQNAFKLEKEQQQKCQEELSKCQQDLQKEKEQQQKIQEELSKCQQDLQKEKEQRIKMEEENKKLNDILQQKQIEIDQLMSKNNTFMQLIKTIDENISQIYQKEVKILVKNIQFT